MATVVHARDLILQSAAVRMVAASLSISGTSSSFTRLKNSGGTTPANITLTATPSIADYYTTAATYAWEYALSSSPNTFNTIAGTSSTQVITSATYEGYIGNNANVIYKATISEQYKQSYVAYFIVDYFRQADDSYVVVVGGESISVQANSSGVVSVYTNTGGTIQVYKSGVAMNYGASGADTFSVGTATISPAGAVTVAAGTGSGTMFTIPDITGMTSTVDSATATYTVTIRGGDGNTLSTQSVKRTYTKIRSGADGSSGVNGTRTAILDMYQWATSAPSTYPVGTSTYTWNTATFTAPATANGWSLTVPATTAGHTLYMVRQVYADTSTTATSMVTWNATSSSTMSYSGTSGVNGQRVGLLEVYQWATAAPTSYPAGTSVFTWSTGSFTAPSTAAGWSVTPGASTAGSTLWGISVRVSDTATTSTSVATWNSSTVYPVGYSGSNGTSGTNAISVILTNTSHTIPTDVSGGNGNYNGSGTNIYVYEGGTALTYDGVGTSNGTWKVTATGTSITAGTISDGGVYASVTNASNMTANTASISYAITGKMLNGTAISITPVQTFSKAVAGVPGQAYWLVADAGAIQQDISGNFNPTSVIFTGYNSIGAAAPTQYSGRFKIYENGSGTASYTSATDQTTTTYFPSSTTVTSIKCEMYLAGAFTTKIDEVIVPVVKDGATGSTGATGTRGTITTAKSIAGTSWADASADTAISEAGGGSPIQGDVVTLYNSGSSFSETRVRSSGGTWTVLTAFFGGNVVVDGTITGAKIVAGAITTSKLAVVDRTNICPDGSMLDSSAWTLSTGATWAAAPTTAWGSSNIVRLAGAATSYVLATSAIFSVIPGTKLYGSAQGQILAGSGSCYAQMNLADNTAFTGATTQYISMGSTTSTSMTEFSGSGTVAAGMRYARVQLVKANSGVTDCYIGAPIVRVMAGSELIVDGAITANKVAAGSISTNKLVVTNQGSALNSDPNTQDINAWINVLGTTTIENIGSAGKIGVYCLRLTSTTSTSYSRATSQSIPCSQGKTYRLSMWARQTSGAGNCYMRLTMLDSTGASLSQYAVTQASGATLDAFALTGSWTFYSGVITPTVAAAFMKVELLAQYSANTGVSEFQDVRVVEQIPGELLVDGTITANKLIITGNNLVNNGDFSLGTSSGWIGNNYTGVQSIVARTSLAAALQSAPSPYVYKCAYTGTAASFTLYNITRAPSTTNIEGIPCSPGDQFYVSASVARDANLTYSAGNFAVRLYWKLLDGTYATYGTIISTSAAAISETAWSTFSNTVTAPANAMKCYILLYSTNQTAGEIYFSDIKMFRKNDANLIVDGAVTANKIAASAVTANAIAAGAITTTKLAASAVTANEIAAGAITTTKLAAGAITTDKLVVTSIGSSLNLDPNTVDISAWEGAGISIVSDTTSPVGGSVLHCASNDFIRSKAIPIDSSKNYNFSLWLKQQTGTSTVYCTVAFYDSSGAVISGSTTGWPSMGTYHYFGVMGTNAPTDWTNYQISFGPGDSAGIPSNAKTLRIGVLSNYTGTGTQRLTGIRLREKTNSDIIVDGSVIKSGKTAYTDTTAGYWIGNDGATPKFVIGSGSNKLDWNGSTLVVPAVATIDTATGKLSGLISGNNSIVTNNFTENNVTHILRPNGGAYFASTATGAILITTPVWAGTSGYLKFKVTVYDYYTQETIEYHVSSELAGSSGIWSNPKVRVVGGTAASVKPVGMDATGSSGARYFRMCIGEAGTTWGYVTARISDVYVSRENYSISEWESNWTIGIITTSLPNYHSFSAPYLLKDYQSSLTGPVEVSISMGSTTAIDPREGSVFYKTITAATTFSVSPVVATGFVNSFMLDLTNGGNYTVTWWSGMKWAGGTAPTLTSNGRDILSFFTRDGGTTWNGLLVAKDIK